MKHSEAVAIIRFAADTILCEHPSLRGEGPYAYTNRFSCDAVAKSTDLAGFDWYSRQDFKIYFTSLGLDTKSPYAFVEFPADEIQGARFLWLDFAALVLEDQPDLFPIPFDPE